MRPQRARFRNRTKCATRRLGSDTPPYGSKFDCLHFNQWCATILCAVSRRLNIEVRGAVAGIITFPRAHQHQRLGGSHQTRPQTARIRCAPRGVESDTAPGAPPDGSAQMRPNTARNSYAPGRLASETPSGRSQVTRIKIRMRLLASETLPEDGNQIRPRAARFTWPLASRTPAS